MMLKKTFSIEEEIYEYLQEIAGKNKSAYINNLIKKEKQSALEQEIIQANLEEAEDIEYQKELADWDITLSDGLN